MKSIKNLLVAVLVFSLATPAFADDFVNSVLGAAIGGAAGSKIGKGNGRKAAIVAGALGGAFLGGNADQGTERRHRETLRAMERQDDYGSAYAPSSQRMGMAQVQQRQVVEYVDVAPVRRVAAAPVSTCDTEYYEGEYDPDMAQAYCRGQQQRLRQEYAQAKRMKEQALQAAYQAGLQGQ